MNKTWKRVLIGLLITVVLAGGVIGTLKFLGSRDSTVSVYDISNMAMDSYWGDEVQSYGSVIYDRMQAVYLSGTMQVTEVLVQEGDEVQTGDPLMKFDTTLTDIEVQRKELALTQAEMDLKAARQQLAEVNRMKPYVPKDPEPEPEPKELHPIDEELLPYVVDESKGTEEDPYVIVCQEPVEYTQSWIEKLLKTTTREVPDDETTTEEPVTEEPTTDEDPTTGSGAVSGTGLPVQGKTVTEDMGECWAIFQVREENALDGDVLKQWGMTFTKDEDGHVSFSIFEPDQIYLPVEDETSEDDSNIDDSSGYTAAEIAEMKKDLQERIRDLDLSLRIDKVDLERMKNELETGEIRATMDGRVTRVLDEETARQGGEPMIMVSAGGGYLVEASVGEFDRDHVHIGDMVTVNSWESGSMGMGIVEEVSDTPTENNGYWSDGNMNVSNYGVTIRIEDEMSLREYEMVSISFMNGQGGAETGLYLENPFIRQENGRSYVYVKGENDLLEKRFVRTGKNVWGSYTQILEGLTMEDKIAFPYGRNIREGAKTIDADISELYQY